MKTKFRIFQLLAITAIFIASCKKDEDDVTLPVVDEHEEEVITTLNLIFTDTSNSLNTFIFAFKDPDGEGGNGPTQFDTIRLDTNAVYEVTIQILNESEIPAEDLTSEVEEEAGDHLFCFTTSDLLTIVRTDSDGQYEIGLTSLWITTSAVENGSVTVTLKHQPDVKNGSCSPGETDIQVTFVLEVEE